MNILIATDSFKGSLSTVSAARQMETGIRRIFPDADVAIVPVADGGEGTVDAMIGGLGGRLEQVGVTGPLGNMVSAKYGILKSGAAVIEMAEASGLTLVPYEKLDVMSATTFGTGELIRAALEKGCRKIYIGIGGSATNDGGVGMAQALGAHFYDDSGKELPFGGGALGRLARIELQNMDKRLKETEIIIICDVDNPLCGCRGASAVYGPQKGASPQMVLELDRNLSHLAQIARQQCGVDAADVPGSGAAGGLGMGLIAFVGAKPQPGIETMLDIANFNEKVKNADLVITGEGRIDGQSVYGKVPVGVAQRAQKYHVPVIAVVGCVGQDAQAVYEHGIQCIFSAVNAPCTVEDAIANAEENVCNAAERAMRAVRVGLQLQKQ